MKRSLNSENKNNKKWMPLSVVSIKTGLSKEKLSSLYPVRERASGYQVFISHADVIEKESLKKKNSRHGRPKIADKRFLKTSRNIKLPEWVWEWMETVDGSRTKIIEEALFCHYRINPNHQILNGKGEK